MKICISILSFFFIAFVVLDKISTAHPHYDQKREKTMEDKIFSRIGALPEIREFIRKHKKDTVDLTMIKEPDSTFKYYWIKVGIRYPDMLRTTYNFYVASKTFKIYYFDTMDNSDSGPSLMSLQQWRRWRSDPRFTNLHTFKRGKIILVN
jgi:hypothetical protein